MKVPKFDSNGKFVGFDNLNKKKLKPEFIELLNDIEFLYNCTLDWKGNKPKEEMKDWLNACVESRNNIYESLRELIVKARLEYAENKS